MAKATEEKLSERELAIRQRVQAGLSRKEAEQVQDAQEAWDKEQAAAAKKAD